MAFLNEVLRVRQVQCLCVNIKRLKSCRKINDLNDFYYNWKAKYSDILIKPNSISNEIWESMRNCTIESIKTRKEVVDAFIFDVFKREQCPDAGINYYKFLETNNYHRSMTIVADYLSLCQLKDKLADEDKEYILNLCNEIIKQYELLPGFLASVIVKSFCQLDKWKEAIEILQKFEKHDTSLLNNTYDTLIMYFLKNDQPKLAWEYLVNGMKKGIQNDKDMYSMYLKYCLEERDAFNERIEKLFSLWREYGVKPNQHTINEYIKACNELGWSAQVVNISGLKCKICRETLAEPQLPKEGFDRLCDAIVKNVVTNNTYNLSDPNELKTFVNFVKHHKPYDFVVDGLNLILSRTSLDLSVLLQRLKDEGKKVLVIGRKHLMKSKQISTMNAFADFFFVNNMTKDDVFILYAAFLSGPGTNIISGDLMRQHKFTFHDPELDILFKKWQMRHQFYIRKNKSARLINLNLLAPIDSCAIKTNNCWHIPYHDAPTIYLTKRHTCNTNWACFNMRP